MGNVNRFVIDGKPQPPPVEPIRLSLEVDENGTWARVVANGVKSRQIIVRIDDEGVYVPWNAYNIVAFSTD